MWLSKHCVCLGTLVHFQSKGTPTLLHPSFIESKGSTALVNDETEIVMTATQP